MIEELGQKWGFKNVYVRGNGFAKVDAANAAKKGKLVLVTAMTSNKSGVGKSTISIGLADAMNSLGAKTMLALREPSMGPVFGVKGGATGGGKSVILPENEINLHFTGDFHAIAQANNLLVSILDNHIFQGNELSVNTDKIYVKRCLDLNDRSLREISYKIGDKKVESGFVITAASEVMAITALSRTFKELKENLGNILVAENVKGEPIFARDLHAEDAMAILLREAFMPNLVSTMGGTPVLVHLGPFANIAHGCNSVVATLTALSHADFCVTEAGFGSDLGAEKFVDIKCRVLGRKPDAAVLVVTLKVVKEQGEGDILKGFENVKKHIKNCREVFGLKTVVALNKHSDDKKEEINLLKTLCEKEGIKAVICTAFTDGGAGCTALAEEVIKLAAEKKKNEEFVYELSDTLEKKIEKIATRVYGAKKVEYSSVAKQKLAVAEKFPNFYVCIAKTQFSFSDDKNLLGAPSNFVFHISDIEIRSGAKMIVPIAGKQLLMPGLAKRSNYLNMSINDKGQVSGIM